MCYGYGFFYHETSEKKVGIGGTLHRIVGVVVYNKPIVE
jgi:hypothetical protein